MKGAPVPTDKQLKEAWEFVRKMRDEWTTEDWSDFYHGIGFAFFRIQQRRLRKPKENDYEI